MTDSSKVDKGAVHRERIGPSFPPLYLLAFKIIDRDKNGMRSVPEPILKSLTLVEESPHSSDNGHGKTPRWNNR